MTRRIQRRHPALPNKQAEKNGGLKIKGSADKVNELLSYMDKFEFWFNIVTP
ncbi:hypothetical protein CLM71_11870 [Serratia sp. MYb239]|nr:hypothetical protein CLM71_11870 [Serratia sp. MYb239]